MSAPASARSPTGLDLELLLAPAIEQAALVRSGGISARELVDASLTAIERLDPEVNAFVSLAPERALEEAERMRPGDPRPLCGVPIAVKDFLTATEGLATSEGSRAFGDWVADHDAAHVRHLREAGAILVGKTNTPELGMRPVTEPERFGPTRNPWDLRLSAGGSSGGSAAAVAGCMVPLADGSDLSGSIRIPAACCGLVGLKPSRGRVSIGPDLADVGAGHISDGVLSRTVLDTAVALDAIAGYEPGDHYLPLLPAARFAEAARRRPGPVRIRLALQAPLGLPIDEQPTKAARRAADLLAELGHHVDVGVPDWEDHRLPQAWETFVAGVVQHLIRVVARLHGGRFDPKALEPATRTWALERPPILAADYLEAIEHLRALTRRILRSWPEDEVLLTPTLTRLPAAVSAVSSQAGVSDDAVRFSALVRLWNMTGQPAISCPLHETADGVPVGVQLVGPPGRDDLLLSLAGQLEMAAGWRPRQPTPVLGA